jgi:hypothetical protein
LCLVSAYPNQQTYEFREVQTPERLLSMSIVHTYQAKSQYKKFKTDSCNTATLACNPKQIVWKFSDQDRQQLARKKESRQGSV